LFLIAETAGAAAHAADGRGVAGAVIGVFGHLVPSRPLILFGIVVVGAVCAYVVVSSYLGAFVS
jgi:hypothetical protein